VWGRGTLDDKVAVMAILEAVEMLVKRRPRPGRTIVLAFGHDEEIGGVDGAGKMAAILKARDDHFEYVLDEGAAVTRGIIPGLKPAVALVGIAEKGSVSVELSAISPGGHSSMPPPQTAAGIVAAAVTALESNPMAAAIDGPMAKLFDRLAPEMPFFERLALSNRWLFGGLITRELGKSPTTNAALRTTTAATILEAGVKENVLPAQARAVVNFRIKPGDTIEGVLKHVTDAIGDRRVNVKLLEPEWAKKASRESSIDSRGFKTIEATIRQVMPDVLVAPSLVVGATDTRHYEDLADEVYRFLPVVLSAEDTSRIHGTDERISVEDYKNCVRFYVQLLTNEGAG
jgi:carboxypeptidase PM20D1